MYLLVFLVLEPGDAVPAVGPGQVVVVVVVASKQIRPARRSRPSKYISIRWFTARVVVVLTFTSVFSIVMLVPVWMRSRSVSVEGIALRLAVPLFILVRVVLRGVASVRPVAVPTPFFSISAVVMAAI